MIEKTCFECDRRFPKEALVTAYTPQGYLENSICVECRKKEGQCKKCNDDFGEWCGCPCHVAFIKD